MYFEEEEAEVSSKYFDSDDDGENGEGDEAEEVDGEKENEDENAKKKVSTLALAILNFSSHNSTNLFFLIPKTVEKPKKAATTRTVKNPQPKLDANRLCGPKGVEALVESFKGTQLKGKGYEKRDLDLILQQAEHWAHRLFPKLSFDDFIEQAAKLGGKGAVQVHMKKLRNGAEADDDVIPERIILTCFSRRVIENAQFTRTIGCLHLTENYQIPILRLYLLPKARTKKREQVKLLLTG
nr:EOG090X0AVC [Macrothrix elegans]